MKEVRRVYVCHTFYHVYVACVKELLNEDRAGADLILSRMSNDFGEMPQRLKAKGLFHEILFFDEQSGAEDEELSALRRDRGNLIANLIQRVKYTRLLGKKQEPFVPVDFRVYDGVYVFCDSDPIGYYLNLKRIPYHALEDGLNCDRLDDMARLSNQGAFRLKAFLAKRGWIFIPNGYSRYCLDYEVNDLSVNPLFPENVFAVPRRGMYDRLSREDHRLLADVFLPDAAGLRATIAGFTKPVAMILTEPLCEPDVRARLFGDIVREYQDDYQVIIKPHPRDLLDYEELYRGNRDSVYVLSGRFPMEVLDDIEGFRVARLISVITQIDDSRFADEVVYLGMDFLDRYEEPAVHRKMEAILPDRNSGAQSRTGSPAVQAPADTFVFRRAVAEDAAKWLSVRNDPESRRNSRSSEPVGENEHAEWFAHALEDPTERLYAVMRGEDFAGYLRLTERNDGVEISYAVAPESRGQGAGRAILMKAKELSEQDFPGQLLYGEVRESNPASLHLFRSCGYRERKQEPDMVRFER